MMSARPLRPQPPKLVPPEVTSSPRIEKLMQAIEAGDGGVLERFWAAVGEEGTPLVESIVGDVEHCIVTFLWRDDGSAKDVLIGATNFTDASVFDASRMERMPGMNLWHRSYRVRADWRSGYRLAPLDRPLEEIDIASPVAWRTALTSHGRPDPLNPKTCPSYGVGMKVSAASLVELPHSPPQPWQEVREDVSPGVLTELRFTSRVLKNERHVWVYTPAGYQAEGREYDLTVLLDGDAWALEVSVAVTLNNLIAAGAIPPMIVVMPGFIDVDTRMRELTCSSEFVEFLVGELVPFVAERWSVTASPQWTIIAGQSLGGLTAAFAGLRAPERFGKVLAQSGSFWWKHGSEFDVEAEWLTRLFAVTPKLPLRFYLDTGLHEWIILPTVRHLRDVLEARGYEVSYSEYNGGHDLACWRGSLADGLIALAAGRDEAQAAGVSDEAAL